MKMSELKPMAMVRDTYIPKGRQQGDMLLKCMDGATEGFVEQFVNVTLTDEQVAKIVPKIKLGVSLITVKLREKSREPFAGAPLKLGQCDIIEIDGKPL